MKESLQKETNETGTVGLCNSKGSNIPDKVVFRVNNLVTTS